MLKLCHKCIYLYQWKTALSCSLPSRASETTQLFQIPNELSDLWPRPEVEAEDCWGVVREKNCCFILTEVNRLNNYKIISYFTIHFTLNLVSFSFYFTFCSCCLQFHIHYFQLMWMFKFFYLWIRKTNIKLTIVNFYIFTSLLTRYLRIKLK